MSGWQALAPSVPAIRPAEPPRHAADAAQAQWRGGLRQGLSFGALALPLAFVALPLYLILPALYASRYGVALAPLGLVLLGTRLADAVVDPWIGRVVDRCFAHSRTRVLALAALAALALALGLRGLLFPPVQGTPALLAWCAALLTLTQLAYSVLAVLHQAWGARLGGDERQRATVVSWREGLALVGVLLASVAPALLGLSLLSALFSMLLLLGWSLLWLAPHPHPRSPEVPATAGGMTLPLRTPAFRRLLLVYTVNGVAGALPATLVLFFIRDRLQAASLEPVFLASYFAAGALSMPLWLRAVPHFGLARCWLAGMLVAVVGFAGAAALGPGSTLGFAAICLASGAALGADLALPGALLAGLVQRAGHGGWLEGRYFGWWNFAGKLNLALAAGIALPVLAAFGYAPGSRSAESLQVLVWAYAVLPCVLKLIAALLLARLWIPRENLE